MWGRWALFVPPSLPELKNRGISTSKFLLRSGQLIPLQNWTLIMRRLTQQCPCSCSGFKAQIWRQVLLFVLFNDRLKVFQASFQLWQAIESQPSLHKKASSKSFGAVSTPSHRHSHSPIPPGAIPYTLPPSGGCFKTGVFTFYEVPLQHPQLRRCQHS